MFGFTMPAAIPWTKNEWKRTKVSKKYLASTITDKQFHDDIEDILDDGNYEDYVCDMIFVRSTYEALDDKASDPKYLRHDSGKKTFDSISKWLKDKVISLRVNFGSRIAAPAFPGYETNSHYAEESIYRNYDEIKNRGVALKAYNSRRRTKAKTAARYATLYRSIMAVIHSYACWLDVIQKVAIYDPRFAAKAAWECKSSGKSWYQKKIDDRQCAGPRKFQDEIVDMFTNKDDFWSKHPFKVLDQFGVHLTSFPNLYGARMTTPLITRTVLDGNLRRKSTELSIATKGPIDLNPISDWSSFSDNIRELQPFRIGTFIHTLIRDNLPLTPGATESSVSQMLSNRASIPDDKLDRAIAVKYESLRFKAEFFPWRMDFFGGEEPIDELDWCNSLGTICFSPGFTTCQFDCSSVGCKDAPVCNQRRLEENEEAPIPRGKETEEEAPTEQEGQFETNDEWTEILDGLKDFFGEDDEEDKRMWNELARLSEAVNLPSDGEGEANLDALRDILAT